MKRELGMVFFIASFFLVASVGFAQTEEVTSVVNEDQIVADGETLTAGITPDSPLYGLDTAWDKIRLLLTFEEKAKARLGLQIARERLLETRKMILEKKIEAARISQREQLDSLNEIQNHIAALRRANSTQEIEDVVGLEKEIEEHENEIRIVNDELNVKVRIVGNITNEQQALIDSIVGQMENKTGEMKIFIGGKKAEIKIKIRQDTGKSDDEVEDLEKKIEIRERLFDLRSEKALEQIEEASSKIENVKSKLSTVNSSQVNVTSVNRLIAEAESHFAKAQAAFNETKFGEAYGQANSAEKLATSAKNILGRLIEKSEEELEIEIETENAVSKVEVRIGGRKFKFRLDTVDRNRIISLISEKFGIPQERVEKVLKIEAKKIIPAVVENLRKEALQIKERIQEKDKKLEILKERAKEEVKSVVARNLQQKNTTSNVEDKSE